jgi:hypothetical protein
MIKKRIKKIKKEVLNKTVLKCDKERKTSVLRNIKEEKRRLDQANVRSMS